jgi:multisubunit Na+/H+ antiporter MnhC subunit
MKLSYNFLQEIFTSIIIILNHGGIFVKLKRLLQKEIIFVALLSLTLVLLSCGDFTSQVNPPVDDPLIVTDVNKFVTDKDKASGVFRTNDQVSPVPMSHQVHEDAKVACAKCHHKKGNDDRIKQCAQCHKGNQGRDVMHEACITCHLTRKQGPVRCEECHFSN